MSEQTGILQNDTHAQIFLQPIAAPSILGLYGLAGATFMVAAYQAHWFGNSTSSLYLFPFAAIFGGLAQFLAGMWSFRARDGVAAAIHGTWGSFWMAYGVLNVLFVMGRITAPAGRWPELGFWFIVLAAITWVCAAASSAENRGFVFLLTFLAAGSTTAAIGELTGAEWLMIVTAYLFIIAAIAAWYAGSALMLEEAFGHEVWGLGRSRHAQEMRPVSMGMGEPGVIRGQA
jgi:uncharacterized protein